MSSADKAALLASLRDIHEPLAPKPDWLWLIAAIALGIGLVAVLWAHRPRKKESLATQQINAARTEPPEQALVRLARLLRARIQNSSDNIKAQTQGDAWLQILDSEFKTSFFTADIGRIFGEDLYRKPTSELNITTLCDQLEQLHDASESKGSV